MSFLRQPGKQAKPAYNAYQTGGEYSGQANTGQASIPESQARNPDTRRLSTEDYFRILSEQLGQLAVDTANLNAQIREAGDFNTLVRVTQFNTDMLIPSNIKWRSAYLSRPSYGEVTNSTGLTAKDLTIIFEDDFAVIVPFYGQIAIPVFGYTHFRVVNNGPGGQGTYPAGWSVDLMFTTRQYNPTQWAVSA